MTAHRRVKDFFFQDGVNFEFGLRSIGCFGLLEGLKKRF
jgi:hypothetical protein